MVVEDTGSKFSSFIISYGDDGQSRFPFGYVLKFSEIGEGVTFPVKEVDPVLPAEVVND